MNIIEKLTAMRAEIDALIDAAHKPAYPEQKLPESLEDLNEIKGSFITNDSDIRDVTNMPTHNTTLNIWPTRELAEAALAMSQLAQLRAEYWRQANWEANWTDDSAKQVIIIFKGLIKCEGAYKAAAFLAFKPGTGQRDHFLRHHRELIEQAEPLL